MNYVRNISIIFMLLIVTGFGSADLHGQNVTTLVANSLKSGNYKEIAKHFNGNVEIKIDGKEEMYSKSQAEFVLKDFFEKNPCKSFVINHQGGSDNLRYTVGDLSTSNGKFRIFYMVKTVNGTELIYQLGIDKE